MKLSQMVEKAKADDEYDNLSLSHEDKVSEESQADEEMKAEIANLRSLAGI